MSTPFTFYKVYDDESGDLLWLGAREGSSPRRFFVWVPNTGRWHRFEQFEPHQRLIPDTRFEEVPMEDIVRELPKNQRIDERSLGWVVDSFREQAVEDTRASTQLGLPLAMGAQPTKGLDIDSMPFDEWVEVRRYSAANRRQAISLASDIRSGKRKKLLRPGQVLDAQVIPSALEGELALEVRKRKLSSTES